jgi:hypothetical protein
LERCGEGRCVPVQGCISTVSGPRATVPQTCVDAHSLAVGEWYSKVFVVFEDADGGSVHIESEDRRGTVCAHVVMFSSNQTTHAELK